MKILRRKAVCEKLGGINDVTNIQLLCEACNLSKGKKALPVSNLYEPWYT